MVSRKVAHPSQSNVTVIKFLCPFCESPAARIYLCLSLQFFDEEFPQFYNFWDDHVLTIRLKHVLLKIILVIILGRIKYLSRADLRHNRRIPDPLSGEFSNDFFSNLFLFLVVVENDRTVLCTDVCALTIQRC